MTLFVRTTGLLAEMDFGSALAIVRVYISENLGNFEDTTNPVLLKDPCFHDKNEYELKYVSRGWKLFSLNAWNSSPLKQPNKLYNNVFFFQMRSKMIYHLTTITMTQTIISQQQIILGILIIWMILSVRHYDVSSSNTWWMLSQLIIDSNSLRIKW